MNQSLHTTDVPLDGLFKRLHLANARRVWRDLIARAEQEQWSHHQLLSVLVADEIAHRQQTRLARLTRRTGFPFLKTTDDFDFTYQSTVRLTLLGSALSPDFVTDGRSLIFLGKPGRGKTHLAVAIGYRAIQNGFDALFVTAAELINDLSAAFRQSTLTDALVRFTHPDVLIVDEIGYLTYGTDAANMLFHVVNERHRRKRAMIFTTNKPLATWGQVLHDEDLAQAITTASSNAVVCSPLTARPFAPSILVWKTVPPQLPLLRWPEFPELTGQNFRNPHDPARQDEKRLKYQQYSLDRLNVTPPLPHKLGCRTCSHFGQGAACFEQDEGAS